MILLIGLTILFLLSTSWMLTSEFALLEELTEVFENSAAVVLFADGLEEI
jgi:hypothetical protein